jgi:hypothetical protein
LADAHVTQELGNLPDFAVLISGILRTRTSEIRTGSEVQSFIGQSADPIRRLK